MLSELVVNSNTKDAPPPEAFSIPVPTTNQVQLYKHHNLGAVSAGEDVNPETDPLAFKSSWNMYQVDSWLSWVLPKAMTWLEAIKVKNNLDVGDCDDDRDEDSESSNYPWVLLGRERNKLVVFKKKGSITGYDLHKAKVPQGKRWIKQTMYFGELTLEPTSSSTTNHDASSIKVCYPRVSLEGWTMEGQ